MALVTRGTSKDGRMAFRIDADDGTTFNYATFRGGYSVQGWCIIEEDLATISIKRGTTTLFSQGSGWAGLNYTIEMIGSTIKIYEQGTLFGTVTDSNVTTAGVWQTESSAVTFVSFISLDAATPAHHHNAIAFGAGF